MRRGELVAASCLLASWAHAGPPYTTDDPEPVPYQHWELYLATQDEVGAGGASGTAPHVEVNYGAWPGVQLHAIAPLVYARDSYGIGDVELGVKLRFVQEQGARPMIGTFPLVEIPSGTGDLGSGHVRAFLPLWLQASSGPWRTYGGGGLWIHPGAGNRNYALLGWQAQRQVGRHASIGGELVYRSPDHRDGPHDLRFAIGLVVDLTDHHHLMASAGRSIVGDTTFQGYFAYQLTL